MQFGVFNIRFAMNDYLKKVGLCPTAPAMNSVKLGVQSHSSSFYFTDTAPLYHGTKHLALPAPLTSDLMMYERTTQKDPLTFIWC